MTSARVQRYVRLAAGTALVAPGALSVAHAKPTASVSVSGNVHYSTNPFLATGTSLGAVQSAVTVTPVIEERTARSTLSATGSVSFVNYSRRYRDSVDYNAGLDYVRAITPQLSWRASADYANSGSGNNFRPEAVSLNGVPSILPPANDITLLGSQVRQSYLRAGTGFSYSPSSRSSWNLDFSGSTSTTPSGAVGGIGNQNDYTTIGETFGYSRQLNARTRVGASLGVSRYDYRRTSVGDSRILSPTLTLSTRIGARWSLSGGVGVTLVRQNTQFGKDNSTNLSFNASLCRDADRTAACINASRNVAPSVFGLTRLTTSVGASYNYRLSTRDSISYSGNYTQSDELTVLGPSKVDYYSGSAQYQRQFRNRLSFTADAGFTRARYGTTRSDARVGIGLAYRLGSR